MDSRALILVTYARQYDIDSNTRGTTVNYFFLTDDGTFLHDEDGQQNAKVSMAYNDRDIFKQIPGVYEGVFSMTIGSDRKPTLRLTGAEYYAPIVIQAADKKRIEELNKNAAKAPVAPGK